MPIFDTKNNIIYIDANLMSQIPLKYWPFVSSNGGYPVFRKKLNTSSKHASIHTLNELLDLYKETNVTIQPLTNLDSDLIEPEYNHIVGTNDTKSFSYQATSNRFIGKTYVMKTLKTYRMSHTRIVKDHLGNRYPTISKMAQSYNISLDAYYSRTRQGWSLEKTLTTPHKVKNAIIKDHLDNSYPSMSALAKCYNIPYMTLTARLRNNWPLERALTTPVRDKKQSITDHIGKTYVSLTDLTTAYDIPIDIYQQRIRDGWTQEKALTKKPKYRKHKSDTIRDHLGNTYSSINDMCRTYNINNSTFYARVKHGWSLEKTLTTPPNSAKDHLGKIFPSVAGMLDHYHLTEPIYRSRLHKGWSLEKTLTTPAATKKKLITDHLGNQFASIPELAKYHNIQPHTVNSRLNQGWSLEKAITTPMKTKRFEVITLKDGQTYQNITQFVNANQLQYSTVKQQLNAGFTFDEILDLKKSKKKDL